MKKIISYISLLTIVWNLFFSTISYATTTITASSFRINNSFWPISVWESWDSLALRFWLTLDDNSSPNNYRISVQGLPTWLSAANYVKSATNPCDNFSDPTNNVTQTNNTFVYTLTTKLWACNGNITANYNTNWVTPWTYVINYLIEDLTWWNQATISSNSVTLNITWNVAITQANSLDDDHDGKIDWYNLLFNKNFDNSTFNTSYVTISDWDWNTADWLTLSNNWENDNTLKISFNEKSVWNTWILPNISLTSYTSWPITFDALDNSATFEQDTAKPLLLSINWTNISESISINYNSQIELVFSEIMKSNNDFVLKDKNNNIISWTKTYPSASELTFTPDSTLSNSLSPYTVSLTNSTQDANSNPLYTNISKSVTVLWTADVTAPTWSILISWWSSVTNNLTTTLSLTTDDATEMCISNSLLSNWDSVCNWWSWEAFNTTKSWALAAWWEWNRTVYIKFKDSSNNYSNSYNSTIYYSTNPSYIDFTNPVSISNQSSLNLEWDCDFDSANNTEMLEYKINSGSWTWWISCDNRVWYKSWSWNFSWFDLNSSNTFSIRFVSDTWAINSFTFNHDNIINNPNSSQDSGNFNNSINITLSKDFDSVIYYTIDWSSPTISSPVYTWTLNFTSTTTLKFFARDNAWNISSTITKTYTRTRTTLSNWQTCSDSIWCTCNWNNIGNWASCTISWWWSGSNSGGGGNSSGWWSSWWGWISIKPTCTDSQLTCKLYNWEYVWLKDPLVNCEWGKLLQSCSINTNTWSTNNWTWSTNTGTTTEPVIIFPDTTWSFALDYINSLYNKWIIWWYEDKTFRPNNPVTRAEFLKMSMKWLGIKIDETITTTIFSDINASWMIPYVQKAKELWIVNWQEIVTEWKTVQKNISELNLPKMWVGQKDPKVWEFQKILSDLWLYNWPINSYFDESTGKAINQLLLNYNKWKFEVLSVGTTKLGLLNTITIDIKTVWSKIYLFNPNKPITRAEAVKILINTKWLILPDMNLIDLPKDWFVDISENWMIPYVYLAKTKWIVSGQIKDWVNIFRPNESITRAESAKVIYKFMNQ